jgi:hypothetical protein
MCLRMKSDRAASASETRVQRFDSRSSFRVGRPLCVAGFAAVLTAVTGPAFAQAAGCSGNVCNVTISTDPGTSYTSGNASYTTGPAGTLSYAVDYANKNPGVTINITTDVSLNGPLEPLLNSMTITGNGHTIDGNNSRRIFMVGVDNDTQQNPQAGQPAIGPQQDVTISGLTLKNGLAQGGNGGASGGGGGMGAGGAIFVNQTGNVTLSNVNFDNNRAAGGAGGGATFVGNLPVLNCGCGGGLGGNGGSGGNDGGGGGIFGNGGASANLGSGSGGGLIGDGDSGGNGPGGGLNGGASFGGAGGFGM